MDDIVRTKACKDCGISFNKIYLNLGLCKMCRSKDLKQKNELFKKLRQKQEYDEMSKYNKMSFDELNNISINTVTMELKGKVLRLLEEKRLKSISKNKKIKNTFSEEYREISNLSDNKEIINIIKKWEKIRKNKFNNIGGLKSIEKFIRECDEEIITVNHKISKHVQEFISNTLYKDAFNKYIDLTDEYVTVLFEKKFDVIDEYIIEKYSLKNKVNNSNINFFNPVEGGETTLYYLRLVFKGKRYYKIGVTINDVKSRYLSKDFNIIEKILYEKKLTHANRIEKKILKIFKDKIFPLNILSSGETEIFDEDVLQMDN